MNRDEPVRIWANAIVHYGRGAPPPGMLSAFSVGSEKEAESLLALACVRGPDGQFVARELNDEQSVRQLFAFCRSLKRTHDQFLENTSRCTCLKRSEKMRTRA